MFESLFLCIFFFNGLHQRSSKSGPRAFPEMFSNLAIPVNELMWDVITQNG